MFYSRTEEGGAEVPKSVRDAIAKAIQLKQAAIDVERDINVRNQRVAEITAEQNRIRENMKTVTQATQYYDRLLAKLNEQESAIETLQRERDALIAKRDSLRRELDEYLSGLTVG
jgi:predicted RNase H-like nuclease (RuvC/YqgF family)